MSNAFALLGLPRVAALDPDTLQQAWLAASRRVHPDQTGGSATEAAAVNAARETLQSPEKRLKHLLELHHVPWRAIPVDAAMMDLFSRLGPVLQQISALLKKRQSAESALAKALLAPEEMRLREQLEELGAEVTAQSETLTATLPELDTHLSSGDTSVLEELQVLQAKLAYLAKWQAQVREALLSLL